MFDTLLASRAGGLPSSRTVVAALLLHALVIVAAISGTASSHAGARPVARDTIRLEMIEAKPSAPEDLEAPLSRPEPLIPAPPQVPSLPLNAPGFQPPSLSFHFLTTAELRRTSLHRNPVESRVSPDTSRPIFSTNEVDELPELVTALHPRYPEALRRAGISGLVQLEYVVGSDGRVDQRSVRVASAHLGFQLAALEALRGARFKPARRAGQPIRFRSQ
jgi:periplasmic protein TonB